MIKKIFFTFLIFLLFVFQAFAYDPYLQKGSLIKVYTKIPLSTESLEEGSSVYFIAPSDVWILEQKAIEKGDIFLGQVSMLKMPILGVNAAMKISISNIIKKDGEKRRFQGHIIFPGGTQTLGGTLTNPASYNTTIHPRKVYGNPWGGTLQYVPSGEYEQGQHVKITSKDSIFIELEQDYFL